MALAAVAGVLIGSVAVGGVLLVPIMVLVFGIDVRTAMAAALFGYVFSGLMALRQRQAVPGAPVIPVLAGAVPGALLGALSIPFISATLLQACVATLTIVAGGNALRGGVGPAGARTWAASAYFSIGAVTGFGSALSGTGGPLILVPLLLLGAMPATIAIGLGQLVQLPIGVLATVGNYVSGLLQLNLGIAVAVGLVAGVFAGEMLRHRINEQLLQRLLGYGLIGIGTLLYLRLIAGF